MTLNQPLDNSWEVGVNKGRFFNINDTKAARRETQINKRCVNKQHKLTSYHMSRKGKEGQQPSLFLTQERLLLSPWTQVRTKDCGYNYTWQPTIESVSRSIVTEPAKAASPPTPEPCTYCSSTNR